MFTQCEILPPDYNQVKSSFDNWFYVALFVMNLFILTLEEVATGNMFVLQ